MRRKMNGIFGLRKAGYFGSIERAGSGVLLPLSVLQGDRITVTGLTGWDELVVRMTFFRLKQSGAMDGNRNGENLEIKQVPEIL